MTPYKSVFIVYPSLSVGKVETICINPLTIARMSCFNVINFFYYNDMNWVKYLIPVHYHRHHCS
ncbi:unnamed protein product [Schistosoma margrebowiei]|uniref:Uncharacterized protein n=1 Tax=Schistosoma margrebowiei TaxID=48269 RepID=A0A3P8EH48_9TREM|nr:unnamed protein product [Schistosoma margrebowiei]